MTGWYWLALAPVAALATAALAALLRMTPLPVTRPHEGGHLAPVPDRLAASWRWWRRNWRTPQLRGCIADAAPDAGPPQPALRAVPLNHADEPPVGRGLWPAWDDGTWKPGADTRSDIPVVPVSPARPFAPEAGWTE